MGDSSGNSLLGDEGPTFENVQMVLKGKTLRIPNLRKILAHWPQEVNMHAKTLEKAVEAGLAQEGHGCDKLKAIQQADVAFFVSRCWPHVDSDTLKLFADLVIWAHMIEAFTDTLVPSEQRSVAFRAEAKRRWAQMLRIASASSPADVPAHPLIESFQPFAAVLLQECDPDQLEELFAQLVLYLDGTATEGAMKTAGRMPSYEDYLAMRMAANGTGFFSSLAKFAGRRQIPLDNIDVSTSGPPLYDSFAYGRMPMQNCPEMKALHGLAIHINFMINDLVSAKREFANGELLNAVFLRATASNDDDNLDDAVQQCVADLQGLVARFDREADGFLAGLESPFPRVTARNAIHAWRAFNVGSLEWSLRVGRYGLAQHMRPDGSLELVLGV